MEYHSPEYFLWVKAKRIAAKRVMVFCAALVFTVMNLGVMQPLTVHAATYDAYQASLLSVAAPSSLAPGEMSQVRLEIKNLGPAAWVNNGKNFVSLYSWNPQTKTELASKFATPSWETATRPLRLPVARVEPGQTVALSFPIKAPLAAGTYNETFILTAEDAAWMKYGQANVTVTVKSNQASRPVTSSSPFTSGVVPVSSNAVTAPISSGTISLSASSMDWSAELVERSGSEWQLDPDGTAKITLVFKNTGKKIWTRDSANFVSLYTVDANNKERVSSLKDSSWSGNAAARLQEGQVRPGGTGTFSFQVHAPHAANTYQEKFMLAAENAAWIQGSEVTLPIKVINSPLINLIDSGTPDDAAVSPQPDATSNTVPANLKRSATLLLRSMQSLTLLGNGRQQIQLGYKNTGAVTWNSRSIRLKGVAPVTNAKWSSVRDDSWSNASEPTQTIGDVKPGEIGFLNFKIKAPAKKGAYTVSLALYADGLPVDGGDIDIPVTVTADGYIEPEPTLPPAPSATPQPNTPTQAPLINFPAVDPVPLTGDVSSLPTEPNIRVGVLRTNDDQMVIRAMQVAVNVTQNGTTVCRLNAGQSATVHFDRTNKVYKLSGSTCSGQSSDIYLFKSEDGIAPMEVTDYAPPSGSLARTSDNKFRSQLELRYTPKTDGVWVINELPIEWYLKGIGETSNVSPQEFQRTLLVTARTYAVYHIQHGTKHADEFYTVDARFDQVYLGYGVEMRNPNVVAAIDATRAQIVTYQGKLAITPYFSRSDGRTRSWGEVWYGGSQYPWLVSVPVPEDQGKALWGHGVGMSASGALTMAASEGKRYNEILSYFYRGTELRKAYK